MSEVLIPKTAVNTTDSAAVTKYEFPEGTIATQIQLGSQDLDMVLQDKDGAIIPDPVTARHPSRNMVARAALQYFEQNDQLPNALVG